MQQESECTNWTMDNDASELSLQNHLQTRDFDLKIKSKIKTPDFYE